MPDFDGFTVLKEIINFDPYANIVMLSESGFKQNIEKCKALGAKGFVVKHEVHHQLLNVIDYVLYGHDTAKSF
jgi:DNA-binding NarL/FixJ family response regulator